MKRIEIRGKYSRRVAILIDGQELTDHSAYGASLLLDPAMVERIDVIHSTGFVLYGQKALAGVVNFITKEGGDEPIQASLTSSYNTAAHVTHYSVTVFSAVGDFDNKLSWSDSNHNNRETHGGELNNTLLQLTVLGLMVFTV
ncbi:MAG: hemoglobin/transferrin/lactoferrin receptor protein [Pseudohongiellaceae bacterium]|jgi:hemoglobin/transferrin/lactoferrin receptor protein